MRLQQALVENVDQILDARCVFVANENPQLFANRQNELQGCQLGIEDHGHVGMAGHALQKRTDDGGLAGADLAGQLDEAAGFRDAVQQMSERLRVALAHEEIARIGRDGERLFA